MKQRLIEKILLRLDSLNLRSVRSKLAALFYESLPEQFAGLTDDERLDYGVLFQGLTQKAESDPDAALRALGVSCKETSLLFVPGFLADLLMATDKAGLKQELRRHTILGTYFDEQMEWLDSGGVVHHKRVGVESQSAPVLNFRIIGEAVRAAPHPVILVTHSKGGIDALEWLLDEARKPSRESLVGKVRGVIAIQSPFFGSPVAGVIVANRILRKLTSYSLTQLGGGPAAQLRQSRRWRCRFYNRYRSDIAAVLKQVPVLCYASSLSRGPEKNAFPLIETARDIMERMRIPNDGLVPVHSAVLPGAAFVTTEGVDHAAPVMPTRLPFDRRAHLYALVEVMHSIIKERRGQLFKRKADLPECDCYTRKL